jgi:hypothetical protein
MNFDVPANRGMLADILLDARANAGPLAPSVWPMKIETTTLVDMLPGLVGDAGIQPVDMNAARCFAPALGCAPESLIGKWPKSHLGTLMDVAIISRYAGGYLRICEVGGGYGRIAEAFIAKGPVHFVMVDAVPAVLMYAYEYLQRAFPHKRIGSYYAGDTYGESWDCFILPAWRTDLLPSAAFDVVVNVESMQEMNEYQVRYFIDLFDRLLVPRGIAYISNARDWKYIGPWEFPATWLPLFYRNTPRSWTPDHPTIVMSKERGDHAQMQWLFEHAHLADIVAWNSSLAALNPDGTA